MLQADGAGPVHFRLSSRMTTTAGKTIRSQPHPRPGDLVPRPPSYEIAISTLLLFQSFRAPGQSVVVSGRACHNRLEALQRTFEHELLHLAEFLAWGRSNCTEPNFHQLVREIFAHDGVYHDLVTPRQLAAAEHGIRVGDRVQFDHEGRTYVGRVNRITRRATVLVADPNGPLYSDGKHYARFYVPLAWLRPA